MTRLTAGYAACAPSCSWGNSAPEVARCWLQFEVCRACTHRYGNAELAQQTRIWVFPRLQLLLQRPPLAMFDPP